MLIITLETKESLSLYR